MNDVKPEEKSSSCYSLSNGEELSPSPISGNDIKDEYELPLTMSLHKNKQKNTHFGELKKLG